MEDVADPSAFGRLHTVQCRAAYHRHRRRLLPSAASATPASPGKSLQVRSRYPDGVRSAQRHAGSLQSDHSRWTGLCSVCCIILRLENV